MRKLFKRLGLIIAQNATVDVFFRFEEFFQRFNVWVFFFKDLNADFPRLTRFYTSVLSGWVEYAAGQNFASRRALNVVRFIGHARIIS